MDGSCPLRAAARSVASPTLSSGGSVVRMQAVYEYSVRDGGELAGSSSADLARSSRHELRSHPVVIGIGAAAVGCAALAAAAVQRGQLRGDDPALAAFTIVAGVSFVSAGLVASARRPNGGRARS